MTTTYDPMLYDVMKENSYQLSGYYLAQLDGAETAAERARLLGEVHAIRVEVDAVDYRDEGAVRAMTARLAERIRTARA